MFIGLFYFSFKRMCAYSLNLVIFVAGGKNFLFHPLNISYKNLFCCCCLLQCSVVVLLQYSVVVVVYCSVLLLLFTAVLHEK